MTDAEKPETPEESGQPAAEGAEDDAAAARLEALEAERSELHDRVLRLAAEMENLRKRTEREVRDAGQYAISGFARDMLSVGDNMRRAIEAVGPQERAAADPALAALIEGVEMTERELLNVLERHNVHRVDPAGERFDPNLHQAVFEVEDTSLPQGTVAQVMQAGFTIGGRVLRPAMVGVARGGPKPEAGQVAPAAGSEEAAEPQPGPSVDRTA